MRWTMVATMMLVLAACGGGASVALDAPREVSAPTAVGAAPIVALRGDGVRATAWVSAEGGGDQGVLHVQVGDSGAIGVLADSLGPIEPHGEAPPKLAWARDGSLGALYAVGKLVPGRRFPASALRFARSTDGGRTWGAPVTVADSALFASYNFHALHAAADGRLYAAWLDGRHGKSAAYIARSDDGGATWGRNVRVDMGESCPCCRTALASGADGTLYLAWRSVLPGSVRDIVVARSTDGGGTWSAPVRVHADGWVYDGCPHAGPALAVDADGTLHATWWTGKDGRAGVWYAQSRDRGRSFAAPVAMGVASASRPAHAQLALGDGGAVVVAWDDGTVKLPRVVVRTSRDGGATFGDAVTASDPQVAAQFPVLGVHARALTLVWAEQSAVAAAHAEHARPNMKDPAARMPLPRVGETRVMLRTGALQ
ncbi:MAG: glycoside hydrolase [Gemmatimonadaceae bacterium]|nr:glycoside hydrolase [Gemmatimonadaceae bacterium]